MKCFGIFHRWFLGGNVTVTASGVSTKVWAECSKCGKKRDPSGDETPAARAMLDDLKAKSQAWQNMKGDRVS